MTIKSRTSHLPERVSRAAHTSGRRCLHGHVPKGAFVKSTKRMITDGNPASLRTSAVTLWGADEGKVAEFLSVFPLPPSARKMDS